MSQYLVLLSICYVLLNVRDKKPLYSIMGPVILCQPAEPTEVQLCKKFIQLTCGCKKDKDKLCISLFLFDHYVDIHAQSSFLSHDELHLALLGCIMCTVITDHYVRDGHNINL